MRHQEMIIFKLELSPSINNWITYLYFIEYFVEKVESWDLDERP